MGREDKMTRLDMIYQEIEQIRKALPKISVDKVDIGKEVCKQIEEQIRACSGVSFNVNAPFVYKQVIFHPDSTLGTCAIRIYTHTHIVYEDLK